MHYSLVAVDFMSEDALHAALTRVAAGLAGGKLRPLPAVAHSLSSVQAALRQMSQARHVGKIVVRSPALQQQPQQQQGCGPVLLTGGLGTLGQIVASWLAQQQVQELHLLGRSGRAAGQQQLQLLQPGSPAYTAATTVTQCDAASSEDLHGLLAQLAQAAASSVSGQAVQGIMHAGGVLADATLSGQTLASLRITMGPKVSASQQLQRALAQQPTTFQLLFSSVASLLGSPGQTNYAAANAALDALAATAQAQVRSFEAAGNILNSACFKHDAPFSALVLVPMAAINIPWELPSRPQLLLVCRASSAPPCSGAPGRALAWLLVMPQQHPAWSVPAWHC